MDSCQSKLTALQIDLLGAFFKRESGFYLTGGAALAGFHLGHRRTDDLDLFTLDGDAYERGYFALRAAAEELGASLETRLEAPGFRRFIVRRADEGLLVDLVLEKVPQVGGEKVEIAGIRIDPLYEILVNKLNTVASRCEIRDAVDLMLLEEAGLRIEDALGDALRKDGGCTPATLAWALSEIQLSDDAELPAGVPVRQLREYLDQLISRLARAASPRQEPDY